RLSLINTVRFFCRPPAPTEIYTLSLHDALPILGDVGFCQNHATMIEVAVWRPDRPLDPAAQARIRRETAAIRREEARRRARAMRSEEHTSELQSRENLVCRLLLEKKNRQQLRAQ